MQGCGILYSSDISSLTVILTADGSLYDWFGGFGQMRRDEMLLDLEGRGE